MLIMQPLLRRLADIAIHWHRLIVLARNPYRPELHYMRGPGPKWHAKHQGIQYPCSPSIRRMGRAKRNPFYKSPNSVGSNQFVSDRPPSITIAAPLT